MITNTNLGAFNCIFLLCLGTCFVSVSSETIDGMSGPRRHQGIFRKQSTNKTIPYSEQPGKELIIVDIDGTLWPFDVDKDPRFYDPFVIKSGENNTVVVNGHKIEMFPEVEDTLLELTDKGYVLAAVSLTNSTSKTMALLNAFDLTKHFKFLELAEGPDKLSLISAVCKRSDIDLQDVLYFEKDCGPDNCLDLIWKHVIIYCVRDGFNKETARKGLTVFDIRPRKGSRFGPQKVEVIEKTNKNKCRPAYEKDGTEIEGWDYNATKIDYSIEEKSGVKLQDLLFLLHTYSREDIHSLLDLGVFTLPIGVSGITLKLMFDALYVFHSRRISAELSDDELPSTTESRMQRKLRQKQEKLERRMLKNEKTPSKNSKYKKKELPT